jgi:hypothetical protein
LPPTKEGQKKGQKKNLEMKKINEDLFTTSVSRKKEGKKMLILCCIREMNVL